MTKVAVPPPPQQNTAPTGSGTQIAALSSGTVGSTPSLPDNALFGQNPNPGARYLIESDPRFTNYRTWISSDAMLLQLSIDPATAQKRLGDGFYEQKLLREQIAQLTGRRFLAGYASDEAEYQALMNSAVTVAHTWHLIPGIALSSAQIAQLTSDIVWLVEREVKLADGTTQKVLAPQLYLAPRHGDLAPTGALLAADSLNLNLTGNFTNAGTVAGRQIVQLAANNIHNLGTIRADSVSLAAQTDLNNLGGRIEAVSGIDLQAGQDITVASTTSTQSTAQGSRTNIDRLAGLYVTGSSGTLSAIAGRDLNLDGAEVINAGSGATTLAATRNLSLGVVTESNRQSIVFDGRNHLNTTNTADTGTKIQTGGDLTLMAGNDLSAKAVDIQATGNVTLSAGNDVSIQAGQRTQNIDEATFHESKSKRPGLGFSIAKELAATGHSTSGSFKSEQSDVVGSQISGQNVTVQANRDASLEAANLTAQEQLKITAGRDLNIVSAEQTLSSMQTRIDKRTNTFGLGKKSLKETVDINQVNQVGSTLRGKAVDLVASNDLTLSASRVAATSQLNLTAGNEIKILAATNVDERKETREYRNSVLGIDTVIQPFRGRNAIQNSLGLVTPNSYVSPGRVKDKISGETAGNSRTAAQSQLSGGAIVLQSGSDTTLQAPVIEGTSLTVTAGQINGETINPEAKLKLEGVKESRTQNQSGNAHSFMWQSMAGLGGNNESLKMPEILLIANPTVNPENAPKSKSDPKPELNATGGLVVDAVALPGTAQDARKAASPAGDPAKAPAMTTVDLKTQAHELAQQPGMAWLGDLTKRDDVDWKTVQLVHDNWDYKHSGLTPEGGIVVAIVVAILTWGAGSALATTATVTEAGVTTATTVGGLTVSTTTAAGVTSYTVAGAVLNAGLTTLATQAATSLINNQGDVGKTLKDMSSKESVKQLVLSMATAGATQGAVEFLQDNGILSKLSTTSTFTERFTNYATRATVAAGVQSAVYGKPLSETTKTALINSLAQTLTSEIGDWGKSDSALIAKTLAHAVVQCAAASVQGQDCGSAALGAAVAETLSPFLDKLDARTKEAGYQQTFGSAIAGLSALLVASLTGTDGATALNAAQMVDYYNRALHQDQIDRIKQLNKGNPEKAQEQLAVLCYVQNCNIAGADGRLSGDAADLYRSGEQLKLTEPQRYQQLLSEIQTDPILLQGANQYGLLAKGADAVGSTYYQGMGPVYSNVFKQGIAETAGAIQDAKEPLKGVAKGAGMVGKMAQEALAGGAYNPVSVPVNFPAGSSAAPSSYGETTDVTTPSNSTQAQFAPVGIALGVVASVVMPGVAGGAMDTVEAIAAERALAKEVSALAQEAKIANAQLPKSTETVGDAAYIAPTHSSTEPFQTHGLTLQQVPADIRNQLTQDLSGAFGSKASDMTEQIVSSSKTVPEPMIATPDSKLYRIQVEGRGFNESSVYYMDAAQLERVQSNPQLLQDMLGLPPNSKAVSYNVYERQPLPGQTPVVYLSNVATVTTDTGSVSVGSGVQTILPNGKLWSEPKLLTSIKIKE